MTSDREPASHPFRSHALGMIAVALIASCGRRSTAEQTVTASPRRDAQVVDALTPDANNLADWLSKLPPKDPAPKPIIRKHAHGDCRTEYAPRPDRDPNPMCLVNRGTFMMGGGKYAPNPTPVKTTVDDFYIDQFEVTVQQAVLFLNAHGNQCPGLDQVQSGRIGGPTCIGAADDEQFASQLGIRKRDGRYETIPGWELTAMTDFSFEGALRYCAWVGKQVPSSAQWEYAARHDPRTGSDLRYPWGDRWLPNHAACWLCKGVSMPSKMPQVGMFDGTRDRADGSSPWGVHDMAGGGPDFVFACDDPNETCHVGAPCRCATMLVPSDAEDVVRLETSARFKEDLNGSQGLRCARPTNDNAHRDSR